jgi:hypothetical protein
MRIGGKDDELLEIVHTVDTVDRVLRNLDALDRLAVLDPDAAVQRNNRDCIVLEHLMPSAASGLDQLQRPRRYRVAGDRGFLCRILVALPEQCLAGGHTGSRRHRSVCGNAGQDAPRIDQRRVDPNFGQGSFHLFLARGTTTSARGFFGICRHLNGPSGQA